MLTSPEKTNSKDIGEFMLGQESKLIWGSRPRGGIHTNLWLLVLSAGAKLINKPTQLSCNPSKNSEIQRHTTFFNARTQIILSYGCKSPLKHSRELQHGRGRISIYFFCAIKGPSILYFISDLFQENDLSWWVPGNQIFSVHTNANHPWAQLSVRLQGAKQAFNETNLYPVFLKSALKHLAGE